MKNTMFLYAGAALMALVSCQTTSVNESSSNQNALLTMIETEPNRLMLNGWLGMSANNATSSRITFSTQTQMDSYFQLGEGVDAYRYETLMVVDANGTFTENTSTSQAELDLQLNQLESTQTVYVAPYAYETSLQLNDERVTVFFEADTAFIDLNGSEELLGLLYFYNYDTVGLLMQTPFDYQTVKASLFPVVSEAEVDAWIAAMLPMVNTIDLVEKTFNGTELTITYQLDQEDLYTLYEQLYLGGMTRDELSEEDIAYLDDFLNDVMDIITIQSFTLSATLNTLSGMITNIFVDIDVDTRYDLELPNYVYDPENENADEYGYITDGTYRLLYDYNYDVVLSATMEWFESDPLLVAPANKEDYLVVLNLQLPIMY